MRNNACKGRFFTPLAHHPSTRALAQQPTFSARACAPLRATQSCETHQDHWGWSEPYIYIYIHRGDFQAKNTECAPYVYMILADLMLQLLLITRDLSTDSRACTCPAFHHRQQSDIHYTIHGHRRRNQNVLPSVLMHRALHRLQTHYVVLSGDGLNNRVCAAHTCPCTSRGSMSDSRMEFIHSLWCIVEKASR